MEVAVPGTEYHIPLQLSGALKQYEQNDLTPILGSQFENINLSEILHSPECDQKIRDIAITSEYKLFKQVEDIFRSITNDAILFHIQISAVMRHHTYLGRSLSD